MPPICWMWLCASAMFPLLLRLLKIHNICIKILDRSHILIMLGISAQVATIEEKPCKMNKEGGNWICWQS